MNPSSDGNRNPPDASKDGATPPSAPKAKDTSAPVLPPGNVDKEGGAPVDEIDLDGDGARRE